MDNVIYKRITENDSSQLDELCSLMLQYITETCEHNAVETLNNAAIKKITQSMIDRQTYEKRYFELCILNDEIIGFYHAKVDRSEDMGYIKLGYGFILEFYIKPEYRRKGFGTQMYNRIRSNFIKQNIKKIYLTTDPVTGKPFWEHLEFKFLGEVSPENSLEILEAFISQ